MAFSYRRRTKGNPCPVCGHDGWCGFYNDGSGRVLCMRYAMGGCAVPAGFKLLGKPGKRGGQMFRPDDGAQGSDATWTKDQWDAYERNRAEREREAKVFRERQINRGRAAWQAAKLGGQGINHPRAQAYIEGRGVKIADLPGCRLPESIRWTPDAWHEPSKAKLPAVIFGMKDAANLLVAVQRVYLEGNRKLPGEQSKRMLGSSSGAACRLAAIPATGVLILCEGVETGLAILAACKEHASVWALMSTSGLQSVDMPAELVDPATGAIRRIIIAADHDKIGKQNKVRPGHAAAKIAANILKTRHPHISVTVAVPCTKDVCGELVDDAGEIAAGRDGVDWLDVYNTCGAEAVRRGILGTIDLSAAVLAAGDPPAPHSPAQSSSGDIRGVLGRVPVIDEMAARYGLPGLRQAEAACLLMDAFAPPDGQRANESWTISYDGQLYVWPSPVDGRPCYVPADERYINGVCTLALDRYFTLDREGNPKPWRPSHNTVVGALTAAMPEIAVWAETMPCWKPPTFDHAGRPVFRTASNARDARRITDKPAENFIATRSGLLDIAELVRGCVEVRPPTPRFFGLNCLNFELPIDLMQDAMRLEQELDCPGQGFTVLVKEHNLCPNWLAIVERSFGGNADAIAGWQEFCGYAMTPDTSLEVIGVLDGLPGSGKSLLAEGLGYAIGEDNVQPVTFETLGGRFDLAPLEGKLLLHMDEFRIGNQTNVTAAMDNLLTLSSGNRARSEAKHAQAKSTRRIYGKFLICCNGFPSLRDDSAAIVRRLRIFPVRPMQGDPDRTLKGKLKGESLGIFLWALDGLRRASVAKAITEPASGRDLREQIKRGLSPILTFVQDHCVVGPEQAVACDVLRHAFRKASADAGHKGLAEISDEEFGRRLRNTVGAIERDKKQIRGVRFHVYRGIRLTEPEDLIDDGSGGWMQRADAREFVQTLLPRGWEDNSSSPEIPFPR